MTPLEKINAVRDIIIGEAACLLHYTHVTKGGFTTEVYERLKDVPKFTEEDFDTLTTEEVKICGFQPWDEPDEESKSLYLIPLWMLPVIDPDAVLTAIDGDTCLAKDASRDIRFGCIAYGFIHTQK